MMIRLSYSFFILLVFSCCSEKKERNEDDKKEQSIEISAPILNENSNKKMTELSFKSKLLDLGEVSKKDTTVIAIYEFTNTGTEDLIIENVNPECSCTNVEFTKGKISPNEGGIVKLSFNIKDKIGKQKLDAVVIANTEDKFYRLLLKVMIVESEHTGSYSNL